MNDPKFCGNCGSRKPDGDCSESRADFEACVTNMQRPSWKPLNEPGTNRCVDCANLTDAFVCGLPPEAFNECQAEGLKYFVSEESSGEAEARVNAWVDKHKARSRGRGERNFEVG
jgi:hypothetical protein